MSSSSSSSSSASDPCSQYPAPPFPAQTQNWPGSDSLLSPLADHGENSYKGTGKLEGLTAIITGGDSGIGRAVAIAFAREGCSVSLSYLPQEEEDAKETEKHVKAAGRECLLIPGDISNDQQCKKIVDETVKKFGTISCLVNNAAYQGKAVDSIEDLDWDRVEFTMRTNIIAMFALCRYAVKHMKPGSTIINTGSIQAYQPSSSILDYATTKAAIVDFTKGLGQELIKKGIRVNCVAPGPIWTPLIAASFPADKNAQFGGSYPIGRPGQPAELAPAYVYLASKDSSYVIGEVLSVTGGKPTM